MKRIWYDGLATVGMVAIGVLLAAKLAAYPWWFIGTWNGTLGIISVLGAAVFLTNARRIIALTDWWSFVELSLWIIAATVVIASMVDKATRNTVVATVVIMGLAWLSQLGSDIRWHHHVPGQYARL